MANSPLLFVVTVVLFFLAVIVALETGWFSLLKTEPEIVCCAFKTLVQSSKKKIRILMICQLKVMS